MHRRFTGLASALLLGLGCAPRYVPLLPASARPTASPECVAALSDARRLLAPLGPELTPQQKGILDVIHSHREAVRACYLAAWGSRYNAGQMTLRFVIAQEGEVCALEVLDNSLHDEALAACVSTAFASRRFPVQPGAFTTVRYTLNMRARLSAPPASPPAPSGK